MTHKDIGKKYEKLASEYLVKNGYIIKDTNFHSRYGEIDIIGIDGMYLCFVEVKYRSKSDRGLGLEAVNKKKKSKIILTAKYYIYNKNIDEDTACRYDVVSIDDDKITLIKDAY